MVYCGVYDNALDNDNYNVAKGFNYHQGPVRVVLLHFSTLFSSVHFSVPYLKDVTVILLLLYSFSGVALAHWVFSSCQIVLCQVNWSRDLRKDCVFG